MTVPPSTYMATVRKGAVRFPKPVLEYCAARGWDLFRVEAVDDSRLKLVPVTGDGEFHASLSPEGILWIPQDLRNAVSMGEQSVMMRVEGEGVFVYLRKVFETLGFRP